MTNDQRFSDEELIAYLDGESEFAPMAQIEAALKTDVVLAQRLDRLRIDANAIQSSFEQLDQLAPSAPKFSEVAPTSNERALLSAAAAAAIALFIGYNAGSNLRSDDRNWMDYVAAYHVLYGTPTLSGFSQTDEEAIAQLTRTSAMIGQSFDLPSVQDTNDLAEYKRAQILEFDSEPLLQLSYLTPDGTPLALCIIKADDLKMRSRALKSLENMAAASWQRDGYAYLLIGGRDEALISALSERFSAAL